MAEERGDYHRDAYMNDRSHVSGTPLFGGGGEGVRPLTPAAVPALCLLAALRA